ncbi:MAG: TonB-dependent receptor [Flavobacteriaceae bacterium]
MQAQDCSQSLFVEVVDLHDGSQMAGARVELVEDQRSLVTSEKGMVVFLNLCKGPKTLLIEHEACSPVTQRIHIRKNNYVKVTLEHHTNELQEIIVAEKRVRKESLTTAEQVISSDQIQNAQATSLGQLLEQISGVTNIRTGFHIAKPVLHGMSGSRLGIVQDGTRVRDQEWGSDHAPSIDPNSADRIRVVKGGAALRYGGDTAAGVIVMDRIPPPIQDSLYGHFSVDTQSNGQGISTVGKINMSKNSGHYAGVQFHLKRRGDLSAPRHLLTNTGTAKQATNLYWGLQKINRQLEVRYRYLDETIGILRSAHIGNVPDLVRALSSDIPSIVDPFSYRINPPKQSNRHHQAHVLYHFYDQNNNRWQWDYDFQKNTRIEYDIRRSSDDTRPAIDMDLSTHTLLGHFRRTVDDFQWETGIAGTFQRNFSHPYTEVKRLIPDYYQYSCGAYANVVYRPTNTWVWEGGLRFDYQNLDVKKYYRLDRWARLGYDTRYPDLVIRDLGTRLLVHSITHYNMLSLIAGVRYQAAPNWQFGLNYTLSDRPPNIGELYSDGLHHSLGVIQYGDLELTNERVHKIHLNSGGGNTKAEWEVEAYFGYALDYIIEEPQDLEQITRGAFPVWQYRSVDAHLWGFDADLTWQLYPDLRYSASAAYVVGENLTDQLYLIDIPPLNFQQQLQWELGIKKNFTFLLNHQFVAEQTRAPSLITPYTIIVDNEFVSGTIDLGAPEEAYHLFGFSLGWQTKFLGMKTLCTLQGQNIFDTTYRNYLNRMRYFTSEMGRNLQLQVRIEF